MDQERLKMVLDVLRQTVDLLYQENIAYAYKFLAVILNQLGLVISDVQDVDLSRKLQSNLVEATQAMEAKDYIFLADILQFEIYDRLKVFVEE